MTEETKFSPPKLSGADHAHATVRSVLGAIPYGGQAAVEVFNALVTPPIEKRRNEWMESVASAIQELQKKDNKLVERLQQDEIFQFVLLQASWAAIRNHQVEKLTALRIAVQNAAITSNDTQLLFVRFVDELTPTHLLVMNFLVKHEKEVAHLESYQNVIDAFSAILKQEIDPFYFRFVCEDLKARGLVRISDNIRDLPGVYSESMLLVEEKSKDPRIIVTDVGQAFVTFVLTSPLQGAP